jgi:hypothetical protein
MNLMKMLIKIFLTDYNFKFLIFIILIKLNLFNNNNNNAKIRGIQNNFGFGWHL